MHHIASVSVKIPLEAPLKRADTAIYNLSWETIEGVSGAIIKSAPAVLGPDFGKVKLVVLACLCRSHVSPTC